MAKSVQMDNDSAGAAQRFATAPISYAGDPSSMEEWGSIGKVPWARR
jgi:hypothetical protein